MWSTLRTGLAQEEYMTLCPIAIVVGCQKCPAFKVCPLKRVIGDQPAAAPAPPPPAAKRPRKKG